MEIQQNYSLKPHNTFGIDVKANKFVEITSFNDLETLFQAPSLTTIWRDLENFLILGGGSNILFTRDYHGLVLKNSLKGIEIISEDENELVIRANAGENWDDLVGYCVAQGYYGLENLSGIPGNVGASPIQNIGAYGAEMKDSFEFLEAFDIHNGGTRKFNSRECCFGYRNSIFKTKLKGKFIILSVAFRLKKKPDYNLSYKALSEKLSHLPASGITLDMIRKTVMEIRSSKLPDPVLIGNAGSFFKNPVVEGRMAEGLLERHPGLICYPAPGDKCKLAAGWLIDQCGWKGYREGDAGVHKDQALVLVNYGQANGKQILDLAGKIQASVKQKFSVELEPEVQII